MEITDPFYYIHSIYDLDLLGETLLDSKVSESIKQLRILEFYTRHYRIETGSLMDWICFVKKFVKKLPQKLADTLWNTLTPFQKFYTMNLNFQQTPPNISLYRIPRSVIQEIDSLDIEYKKGCLYLFHQKDKHFLIVAEGSRIFDRTVTEIYQWDSNFVYFCPLDYAVQRPKEILQNFPYGVSPDSPLLKQYLIPFYVFEEDLFVYKNSTKPIVLKRLPTLLGNFVAAEKLSYHSALTKKGLMHPSTQVFHSKDIIKMLNQSPITITQSFTQQQMTQFEQSDTKHKDKKIIKLPFSSCATGVQFGRHALELLNGIASQYGWIVQQVNRYPVSLRGYSSLAIFEIRCMVIDARPLCGIVLIKGLRVRVFDVVYPEKRIVLSPYLEKAIQESKGELFTFLSGLRDVVHLHQDEIIILLEKSFKAFNSVVIHRTLPKTLYFDAWKQQTLLTMSEWPVGLGRWKKIPRHPNPPELLHSLNIIQNFIKDPENYRGHRFYEKFLRIDIMYWYQDKKFYVNEIETWACGKQASSYNPDINTILLKELLVG